MNKAVQLPLIIRDRRRRHWYWIPDIIIDLYAPFLDIHGLAVYNVLSRFAERDAENVTIKLETLAERIRISERQAQRELRKLEKYGLISVVQRGRLHLPNIYTLLDPPEEITFVGRATSETPVIHNLSTGRVTTSHPRVTQSPLSNVVVDPISLDQQQHIEKGDYPVTLGEKSIPEGYTSDTLVSDAQYAASIALMMDFGISRDIALDLSRSASPDHIEGWIAYAKASQNRLKSPQGFVVDRLRKGADPPPPKIRRGSQEDRYRYLQGEYAEHIQY